MNKESKMENDMSHSELILFQSEDGQTKVNVILDGKTVWLNQKMLSDLYDKSLPTVNEHIKNIYAERELQPEATIRKFRIVQTEGTRQVTRNVDFYNLDMILAVGYRVRSHRGTQFRQWATNQLREFLVKGFVIDDDRLKDGRGYDYFDELLERIRDIRASEKRFYQKIKDIYATAIDYDGQTDFSQKFFATVQNKLHWAIHGHTAAELIAQRSDPNQPNMGLTTWKGSKVRKGDVSIAKNYLNEEEMQSLNRIVTMYLDYAEDQASRRKAMTMKDWSERLNAFLQFNEREVLQNAGTVSAAVAKELAKDRYEQFNQKRLKAEAQQALTDDLETLANQVEKHAKDNLNGN